MNAKKRKLLSQDPRHPRWEVVRSVLVQLLISDLWPLVRSYMGSGIECHPQQRHLRVEDLEGPSQQLGWSEELGLCYSTRSTSVWRLLPSGQSDAVCVDSGIKAFGICGDTVFVFRSVEYRVVALTFTADDSSGPSCVIRSEPLFHTPLAEGEVTMAVHPAGSDLYVICPKQRTLLMLDQRTLNVMVSMILPRALRVLLNPTWAVCCGDDGTLFLADNRWVVNFDPRGGIKHKWTVGGPEDVRLSSICYWQGELFLTDTLAQRVWHYTPEGENLSNTYEIRRPVGGVCVGDGQLFVGCADGIRVFS